MIERIALLCLFVSLAFPLSVAAVVDTSSPEVSASTDTATSFAAAPALAASSNGAVVVWQQLDTAGGTGWDIYARRYDSNGNPLAGGPLAVTVASGCQRNPSVTMDPSGNFLVVWETESSEIRGRLFRASDSTFPFSDVSISTGDATHRRMLPAVAVLPAVVTAGQSAKFLVVWQGENALLDTSGFGVAGRLVTAAMSGTVLQQFAPVGSEFLASQSALGAQTTPGVAFKPAFRAYPAFTGSRFIVVWQSDGGAVTGVYRRFFDASGGSTPVADGGEVLVSTNAQTAEPSVAADASGNYTVAWRETQPEGVVDVKFHRFPKPTATEMTANLAAIRSRIRPAVAAIGSGDFAITWDSEPQDAQGRGVFTTVVDPTEPITRPEVALNTTASGDQEASGAAATYGGTVLTAWQGPVPGKNTGIWTRPLRIAHQFFTLTPCRPVDTRNANGPLGGPILTAGAERSFPLAGVCGIPAAAKALSLNLTIVSPAGVGDLQSYPGSSVPAGAPTPDTTSLSFKTGVTRANNAVIQLAADGSGVLTVKLLAGTSAHFIIDVNGYFQ